MTQRYAVHHDGPLTTITPDPDGEWLRFHHARAAAIAHLEEMVAEAEKALWVLRRSPTFEEYGCLREETATRPVLERREGRTPVPTMVIGDGRGRGGLG